MSGLPDTTSGPRRQTAVPWYAVLAVSLVAAAAVFSLSSGGEEAPARGEEVHAGVAEIAASTQDMPFPGSDASRFDPGTTAVRVYLRVEKAPVTQRMVATVERTGRTSALSALFGAAGVRAEDGGEGRLSVSEDGASGVVSFAVRAADGGALPEGGYRVEVRFNPDREGGEGRVAARKYFVIRDPQD